MLDEVAALVRNLKTVFLRVGRHSFFLAGFHLRSLGLCLRKRRLLCGAHFSSLAGELGLISQLFLLHELRVALDLSYRVSGESMHVLEVAAEIATLGECFVAARTRKWPLSRVFAEVVAQVAAFLESGVATWVAALEVELDTLRLWVFDSNGLVPLLRDAVERLRLDGFLAVLVERVRHLRGTLGSPRLLAGLPSGTAQFAVYPWRVRLVVVLAVLALFVVHLDVRQIFTDRRFHF